VRELQKPVQLLVKVVDPRKGKIVHIFRRGTCDRADWEGLQGEELPDEEAAWSDATSLPGAHFTSEDAPLEQAVRQVERARGSSVPVTAKFVAVLVFITDFDPAARPILVPVRGRWSMSISSSSRCIRQLPPVVRWSMSSIMRPMCC